jgi:hypothetical protein
LRELFLCDYPVATQRDGLLNTKVVVTTSGGDVAFRVSHDEAEKVKSIILQHLMSM